MMRFDLLAAYGEYELLARELAEYYTPMAELTGTLWEHDHPRASCSHGFASHAAVWLLRDLLGLHRDLEDASVYLEPTECGLQWVKARLPWPSGVIDAGWRVSDEGVETTLDVE